MVSPIYWNSIWHYVVFIYVMLTIRYYGHQNKTALSDWISRTKRLEIILNMRMVLMGYCGSLQSVMRSLGWFKWSKQGWLIKLFRHYGWTLSRQRVNLYLPKTIHWWSISMEIYHSNIFTILVWPEHSCILLVILV